ncbi:MAG: alpha-N-arabinofuranosidase [Bacteroidales bacterium]|nr:alpha-N-arabinofuranosidase [Bacteroidales bacterium]
MVRKYLTLALLATSASYLSAQVPAGGKKISNELLGIFFEDISSSADGGLSAELVQNGSFEYSPIEHEGWGAGTAWKFARPGHSLGYMEPRQINPLNANNTNYMHIHVERVKEFYDYKGWKGVGLQNDGFDGILIKKGAKYDFSVFMRNTDGKDKEVRVVLSAPQQGFGPMQREPKAIGEATIKVSGNDWKKYSAVIEASDDCAKASLQILSLTEGDYDIDMVSLYPQETFKGHGMRTDLAQALADLHPKFMRFPGGCVVHGGGDGFWNTYMWKNSVGPKEQRKGQKNTWGYHQSLSIGYYEYFQFCEDLGMEPVPILPCGVNCQGSNGGWNMYPTQAQDACPMSDMEQWTQDALDLIEWANGDASTKWGKVRAEAGHPAPFNLKYLGLGNEEKITPEFEERFKYMYEKITAAHPEIVIVGTAGPGSHAGNPDYEEGWKFATSLGVPILDEHYYEPRDYFLNKRQYDNYPRDRKTKVYLGEYAAKDKKLIDALAEGLYLLHVEKNADVVVMTSYAPLFARKGATNWDPDLIYFDNERPFLTCSYYVQQMFGLSSGDYYYGDCVKFNRADDNLLGQSVVLDSKAKKLYVKICNAGAEAAQANIDLSRFKGMKPNVVKTTISGKPDDENNYESQPIVPIKEDLNIKAKLTEKVAPYSFVMYTISL